MFSIRSNKEKTIVIPAELRCPLSEEIMREPVMASNGMVYDRHSLEKVFMNQKVSTNCPKEEKIILLPDGNTIKNSFTPDRAMKLKLDKFLKANPDFVMPIPDEIRNKFIEAVSKNNHDQMHLSICVEPALLTAKLYGEKTVFQHLIEAGEPEKLSSLLEIAKTKWSASVWYGFFENHITNRGKAWVIITAVLDHILMVNDRSYSDENTLLHLAAKSGHKRLVERLVIECDADTYIKNAHGKLAKHVAPEGSGIQQLIRDSLNKKAVRLEFEPKEKELNEKIRKLESENAAMRIELSKTKDSTARIQKELTEKIQKESKDQYDKIQKELGERVKKLEDEKATMKIELSRIAGLTEKIKVCHNNFATSAYKKGFFAAPGRLVSTQKTTDHSTLRVEKKIESCGWNSSDFKQKDTYATLINSSDSPRYRPALFENDVPIFESGLNSSEENSAYNTCLI